MEKDIPVYPVNSHEAHIFSNRMKFDMSENEHPLKFPFVTLLASHNITQIVLTQGVGQHRVFGTSIDVGLGAYLAKVYNN